MTGWSGRWQRVIMLLRWKIDTQHCAGTFPSSLLANGQGDRQDPKLAQSWAASSSHRGVVGGKLRRVYGRQALGQRGRLAHQSVVKRHFTCACKGVKGPLSHSACRWLRRWGEP